MSVDPLGDLLDPLTQVDVLDLGASQLHEGAHDQDVHRGGAVAGQDAREYGHALFGEGVRQVPPSAATLKAWASSSVSWNMKSAGKRAGFRRTAWFRRLVSTP